MTEVVEAPQAEILLRWRRPAGLYGIAEETYVVELPNGTDYHVIPGEPLYEVVAAEAEDMGEALLFEPIPEPPPLTIDDFRRAIQAHIDATAQQRSYDSGVTCSSYVNSTNEDWAAEASAFVAWRDSVWVYAYTELAKVEAGQREPPSITEILAELPAISWPA